MTQFMTAPGLGRIITNANSACGLLTPNDPALIPLRTLATSIAGFRHEIDSKRTKLFPRPFRYRQLPLLVTYQALRASIACFDALLRTSHNLRSEPEVWVRSQPSNRSFTSWSSQELEALKQLNAARAMRGVDL